MIEMREPNVRWQTVLAAGFTSAGELLTFLNLPVQKGSVAAEQQFKTRVPRGFASRMAKENPQDPLLLQVLAVEDELVSWDAYVQDPLIEAEKNPHPGLLHKYPGRVLLMMTGACAVHCRYCFRRHFPYEENHAGHNLWHDVLLYIAADPTIHEVILSGGDPLLANDKTLASLLDALASIDHVQTVRFHTRIPVVLPERVDEGFLQVLSRSRLHCVVVLHANHPNELNEDVDRACAALKKIGVYLLNQSVLLKGVNDNSQTLVALSQRLFQSGVLPYYLHVLDKVQGAAHFDVSDEIALQLFYEVQASLPGYLVPRLVREIPGALSKRLVGF